jgi:hypothetical protein
MLHPPQMLIVLERAARADRVRAASRLQSAGPRLVTETSPARRSPRSLSRRLRAGRLGGVEGS